ncbi:MAG: hypothetical protein GXX83_10690 [Gaiellales bacterium]|nr:hypothetical protein [Gaiellales bacterium]
MAVLLVMTIIGSLCLPATAHAFNTQELAFLGLINDYRRQNGLGELMLSSTISEACGRHNSDMGAYGFFSHYTVQSDFFAPGSAPWDRMAASGYDYSTTKGENIAAGFATAQAVFEGWRNSPGHNANMLNSEFRVIGISMLTVSGSAYGTYWTTDFGGYIDASARTEQQPRDTQRPVVSITSPSTGATVSGENVVIDLTASDNVGVTRTELTINDTLTASDIDVPYQFVWDTTKCPDGAYTLRATAFDAAGNTNTMAISVTVINQTAAQMTSVPPAENGFVDVPSTHPYFPAVDGMKQARIIDGYQVADGWEFRIEQEVNRAQFAKMICGAMGIEVSEGQGCSFSDLGADDPSTHYPHQFIAAAAGAGIAQGVAPGRYAPWDSISRAQLITMVIRAAQSLKPNALDTPPVGFAPSVALTGLGLHDTNLKIAEHNGLLAGLYNVGLDWDPWAPATRGEVAALLWALMNL